MYLIISETSTGICLQLKWLWHITSKICRSSFITLICILTKLSPLSLIIYLQPILDNMTGPLYKFYSNSILIKGFSSNLTQMFTPTGQCAKSILPLYQLYQGHWWGFEPHSAIVLVATVFLHCLMLISTVCDIFQWIIMSRLLRLLFSPHQPCLKNQKITR